MKLIGILLVLAGGAACQDAPPSEMACVVRLEVPRYPPIAAAARIEATVTAVVLLGQDGHAKQVTAEASPRRMPIFETPVSETLGKGLFRPECAGKSVKLVLRYSLEDASGVPRSSVSFGYPNEFWITTEAMLVQP